MCFKLQLILSVFTSFSRVWKLSHVFYPLRISLGANYLPDFSFPFFFFFLIPCFLCQILKLEQWVVRFRKRNVIEFPYILREGRQHQKEIGHFCHFFVMQRRDTGNITVLTLSGCWLVDLLGIIGKPCELLSLKVMSYHNEPVPQASLLETQMGQV